ncbi:hypothetical protein [Marinococcus sp. PL1-022]|uniref:hypothetical protein n=1 Tax=Marinococcus sp. PL1-022 TaxID=3095363 RepID=UPI0029C34BA9|nr:hypothetical protein [Marinococcus sp. PL1-022]MDX6153953.1 hypothetical protein [Marinococcus sp. PL1-022]
MVKDIVENVFTLILTFLFTMSLYYDVQLKRQQAKHEQETQKKHRSRSTRRRR